MVVPRSIGVGGRLSQVRARAPAILLTAHSAARALSKRPFLTKGKAESASGTA
jgi:hypothetical protein